LFLLVKNFIKLNLYILFIYIKNIIVKLDIFTFSFIIDYFIRIQTLTRIRNVWPKHWLRMNIPIYLAASLDRRLVIIRHNNFNNYQKL